MTTRRNLFLALGFAALAVAVAVPAAFSHGPGPDGGERRGHRMERMAEKLGLDDKQTTQLKALKEAHQDDAQALHEQIQAVREQQRQLWLAASPDKAKILANEREVLALEGQLAEARVDFMFKARAVLTPAQFTKFVEMRKHHGRFGKGGKGGWGRHHGGRGGAPDDVEQ